MKNFSLSALLSQSVRRKNHNPTRIIVGSFAVVILAGALLLTLPVSNRSGEPIAFLNALFTATSATCVTGLVVFDTYTQFTFFGQCVILILIQIGGLGLVTLTAFFNVAVGRRLGFQSLRLASESINLSDPAEARSLLWIVMKVAFSFEAVGALLLGMRFVPQFGLDGLFLAVFISISAFCNAGFDLMGRLVPNGSLMPYASDPFVLTVVAVLIISGGLGFLVWRDLSSWRLRHRLRTHTKLVLVMTATLLVLGTAAFAVLEWENPATLGPMSTGDKLLNAAFQSVSARTAGFASINLGEMTNVTKMMSVVLMFIGAAPGGTGGGIKVTTISVILVAVFSVVRGREEADIFGRRLNASTVYKSLTILVLSFLAVLIAALTLFYNTGPDVNEVDSIYEATSAFATVGNSVGVTTLMNPFARFVIILTMFIGRVGPVSMGITFAARKERSGLRRAVPPSAHIIVG